MSGLPQDGGSPPHQSFYKHLIAPATRILGIELRPFSIGSEMLLHSTWNNFVTHLEKPTVDDLISGIVICSQEYHEALHDLQHPGETAAAVKQWQRKVSREARKEKIEIDFPRAIQAFSDYIKESEPPTFIISEGGSDIEAPAPVLFLNVLTSKLGWTFNQALNEPKHLATWAVYIQQAMEGKITLLDADILDDAQRHADAFDAAYRAGRMN